MSTTTKNYGLVKPELTDVSDITAMNQNWDKIDEELGNVDKQLEESVKTFTNLDQLGLTNEDFVADDFSANMRTIQDALGNRVAILHVGYRNGDSKYVFTNFYSSVLAKIGEDNGVTFDLATHSFGFTYTQSVSKYTPAKIEVTVERTTDAYDLAVFGCVINYNSSELRIGKFKPFITQTGVYSPLNKPTAEDVGALPIKGGTLTGNNIGLLNGQGKVTAGTDFIQLETYKKVNDTSNRRLLALKESNAIGDSLQVVDWTDGTPNYYSIYGEHNKPTPAEIGAPTVKYGSYAGNSKYGSANPNSITFDFIPKLVILQLNNGQMAIMRHPTNKAAVIGVDSENTVYLNTTWNNNTVTWYNDTSALYQFNTNGGVCYYTAFG